MSEYSGFKIKRPHSLAPLTSVYEAVAVDGRPGRFALKIFHPPASTQARRIYAIEGWLLAAERQKDAARKDGSVLEVLACGRCEEGAFAVMPWQERFLEPWIKTLHPKGDTLRALATCLLNSIEAWEKETGGPHGNLKPANIFLDHSGPLTAMTARLSDPAFMPGATTAALRLADLNAVGTMLATIVRRRLPGAWPIEEAPEWKSLGNGGKGWLDFCNYLLNPQPGEGEVTLEKARVRLKKVPKDANPVKTAALMGTAVVLVVTGSILGFARFGNPDYMPLQLRKLAETVRNPRAFREDVVPEWALLCHAWDTWLIDLQNNAGRLDRTNDLWAQNDQLKVAIAKFVATQNQLRPEALVQEAAAEKRLGLLADSPPDVVRNELLKRTVSDTVVVAWTQINTLRTALERWQRWDEMRALLKLINDKGYNRAAAALSPKLPLAPGTAGYKLDVVHTLKLFNDISLDDTGTLPLASRWSEISHLSTDMLASGDRIQKEMPNIILSRLVDMSSLSDFADSLVKPLEEMRLRRQHFLDPQVVRERFLKQSELLKGTEKPSADDIEEWEKELVAFSKVPKAEDPRFAPDVEPIAGPPPATAVDLETEAPEGDPGNPMVTLSKPDFDNELGGLQANLKTFQAPEIVRRDVPVILEEKTKLTGGFQLLLNRLEYTLTLLKPEPWLEKLKKPYGNFDETKKRWNAWSKPVLATETPATLGGKANRPHFRKLRENEGKVKAWINGVEGPTGFKALIVPDLSRTGSSDTVSELKRLEALLRERKVTAVAEAQEWPNEVPAKPWAESDPKVRQLLEDHRAWLNKLPEFASNLDELSELLTNGYVYDEGVRAVADKLKDRPGLSDLAGKPGEWRDEAYELARLVGLSDRVVLKDKAQSVGLSRKRMAWRQLGTLADWPAGATDFDFDLGVVAAMRKIVGQEVKDEARKTFLLDEMGQETRQRFNRAARFATRAGAELSDTLKRAVQVEAELTGMFSLMQKAGLTEPDLDEPVRYNLALWRLKRYDHNEKNLDRLRDVRDTFVAKVNAISGVKDQADVAKFVKDLSDLELKDDPNRPPTPSPATAGVGWQEVPTEEGMGLTATWKSGAKTVKLDFYIVQADGTPPFYLAVRPVAVGEFLDLMAGRPNDPKVAAAVAAVKAAMPDLKLYDLPMAWRPRPDFSGFELGSDWIFNKTSASGPLLADPDARAKSRELEQAATDKPTWRSPLQQVSGNLAKTFAEKMLGARLPTRKEWQAVLQATNATTAGAYFRGPSVQKLFNFLNTYQAGGTTFAWRPNVGVFAVGGTAEISKDDGRPVASTDENRVWFHPVDEGPTSGGHFINLLGNVSIFLAGEKPTEFYVAGGSVLSLPGTDFTQPQKVNGAQLVGSTGSLAGKEAYSDVGIRPAFDAPPGTKERFRLNQLVRDQKYLTL